MQRNRTRIRLMDGHYETVTDGYTDPEPIIHLFGRDEMLNRRHVRVEGFHPYFCAPLTEVLEQMDDIQNDHRIRGVETQTDEGEPITSYRGRRLARITTVMPWHVGELRELFTDYEADVQFLDRFQYDTEIEDAFTVPTSVLDTDEVMHVDDIEPCDPLDVPARVCYMDIEVRQTDDGPSVISERGKELAENAITAISAYDNYLDDMLTLVLEHPSWDESNPHAVGRADVTLEYYDDERTLLRRFASWMDDRGFDVMAAWNASFDFPYLINRYFTLDETAVYKLSDTRGVDELDGSGRFMNSDVEGLLLFDLLVGYEKSMVHQLDDSSLSTVAAHETQLPKLDVADIDEAWATDPESFIEYSIRDVESMRAIDVNRGVLAS